jgi:hypothetical protein
MHHNLHLASAVPTLKNLCPCFTAESLPNLFRKQFSAGPPSFLSSSSISSRCSNGSKVRSRWRETHPFIVRQKKFEAVRRDEFVKLERAMFCKPLPSFASNAVFSPAKMRNRVSVPTINKGFATTNLELRTEVPNLIEAC